MRLVENRKLAWVVLAVCVVVSIFLLGGAALSRERGQVLKVFNEGANPSAPTRQSMDACLDNASEQAKIMISEAELHLGESELSRAMRANTEILDSDLSSLDSRYAAYTALKDQVERLYNQLYGAVDQATFKNFKMAYDDFWGQDDMMGRDPYHKLAKGYNELISGFPGGLVATLTRQGALNTFGG